MSKQNNRSEAVSPPSRIGRARAGAKAPPSFAEALSNLDLQTFDGEPINHAALEIGEQIRAARQAAGLTQAELARRVGCHQGDLSDIERGKGRGGPRYGTLKLIATALGVPLPIYPAEPHDPELLTVKSIGDSDRVSCSRSSYAKVYPLLSDDEWAGLNERVMATLEGKSDTHVSWLGNVYEDCVLVNIGPSAKASIRSGGDYAVVTRIRGGARIHIRNAVHRFTKVSPGDPVAILDGNSEFEVSTRADESVVFMVVPAGVLKAQAEAD